MKTFGFRQCVKIISLLFAKTEFLPVKREFNGIILVQPPVFRINSFSRRISLPRNQTQGN